LLEMCQAVESVHIDPDLVGYIAQIVQATRADRRAAVGASPRGSLAFLRMARAYAALQGRDFVLPDDIKNFARPVLSHRIVLQPEFWLTSQVADKVVDEIIARVRVPVLKQA
ncbi:MAG: MoxR family ATPase, partial [Anaerolineales bacterium]